MARFLEKKQAMQRLSQAGKWLDVSRYVLALQIPRVHRWLWSAEYVDRLTVYCNDAHGTLTIGGIRQFAAEANTQQTINEIRQSFESALSAQGLFTPGELARLLEVKLETVELWMKFKTPLLLETSEEAQRGGRKTPCFTTEYLRSVLQWSLPVKV